MLVIHLVSNYVIRSICLSLYNHSVFTSAAKITTSLFFFARYKAERWWFRSDTDTHLCCRAPDTSKAAILSECDSQANSGTWHKLLVFSSSAGFCHRWIQTWMESFIPSSYPYFCSLAEHSLLQSVWRWACLQHSSSDSLSLGCIPQMLKIPSY